MTVKEKIMIRGAYMSWVVGVPFPIWEGVGGGVLSAKPYWTTSSVSVIDARQGGGRCSGRWGGSRGERDEEGNNQNPTPIRVPSQVSSSSSRCV